MKRHYQAPVAIALLAAALAGCGGGEPSAAPAEPRSTVSGAVVKGPLRGATVDFFAVDAASGFATGSPLVPAVTTNASGAFSVSGLPTGVLILVKTSGGSYVDESDSNPDPAARRRITFTSTEHLEAIIPVGASTVAITPYSMALLQKARMQAAGANFLNVFAAVQLQAQQAFGFDPLTAVPADPLTGAGGRQDYALLLGAAAQAINAIAVNAGHLPAYNDVVAFVLDLADGEPNAFDLAAEIRRFGSNNAATFGFGVTLPAVDLATLSQPAPVDNQAPTITGQNPLSTAEETALTLSLADFAVSDPDDATFTLTVQAGTGYLVSGNTITPAIDFNGTLTVPVVVSDGTAPSAAFDAVVTVTPVNDAPIATDDTGATTPEDTPLDLAAATLLANDLDADGDVLTITAVANAVGGSVSLAAGTVTFTPAPGVSGAATFDYTLSDGTVTDTGTVTIAIGAVNDPPVATDDLLAVDEDTPLDVLATVLLANDTDADGPGLTLTAVGNAVNGGVSETSGTVTFVPAPQFSGSATFEYTLSDGGATDVGLVTVTVNPVNDAPVALGDTYAGTQGGIIVTTVVDGVLANDGDIDGPSLSASTIAGALPLHGDLLFNSDGSFTYTHGGSLNLSDSFMYQVCDGAATPLCATATVTLTFTSNLPLAEQLLGNWQFLDYGDPATSGNNGAPGIVYHDSSLSFLPGGFYVLGANLTVPAGACDSPTTPESNTDADDGGTTVAGIEYGRYAWNPGTGDFSVRPMRRETDGFCGFNEPPLASTNDVRTLALAGDVLTFAYDDGTLLRFQRTPSTASTLQGAFLYDGSLSDDTPIVFQLFPAGASSGRYTMADATSATDELGENAGFEVGCYTIDGSGNWITDVNPATCPNAVNGNGSSGIDGVTAASAFSFTVTGPDTLLGESIPDGFSHQFTRLPLPPGVLAVPTEAQLLGAWTGFDPVTEAPDTAGVLAFFAGGQYLFGLVNEDPNCDTDPGTNAGNASDPDGNGVEWGTYTLDAASGTFDTQTPVLETNGTCGLYSPNPAEDNVRQMFIENGDTVALSDQGGAVRFRRVPSVVGQIRGAFLSDGTLLDGAPTVFAFYPDALNPDSGRYLMADATQPFGASASPGVEHGCYSVDTANGDRTTIDLSPVTCPGAADTNGDAGISHSGAELGAVRFRIDLATDKLRILSEEGTGYGTRLPLAGADVPQPADTDGDGLTDAQELAFAQPTDPNNADSDGDGFSDFVEVKQDGDQEDYDPANGDSDPNDIGSVPAGPAVPPFFYLPYFESGGGDYVVPTNDFTGVVQVNPPGYGADRRNATFHLYLNPDGTIADGATDRVAFSNNITGRLEYFGLRPGDEGPKVRFSNETGATVVCDAEVDGDLAGASRDAWFYYQVPGTGTCDDGDEVVKAAKLSFSDTQAPITPPGGRVPTTFMWSSTGALIGQITVVGGALVAYDGNLQNPQTLIPSGVTCTNPTGTFICELRSLSHHAREHLFVINDQLRMVTMTDAGVASISASLGTIPAGYGFNNGTADVSNYFLILNPLSAGSARIMRLPRGGGPFEMVYEGGDAIAQLEATTNKLVFTQFTGAAIEIRMVDRLGTNQTTSTLISAEPFEPFFFTNGNRIVYSDLTLPPTVTSRALVVGESNTVIRDFSAEFGGESAWAGSLQKVVGGLGGSVGILQQIASHGMLVTGSPNFGGDGASGGVFGGTLRSYQIDSNTLSAPITTFTNVATDHRRLDIYGPPGRFFLGDMCVNSNTPSEECDIVAVDPDVTAPRFRRLTVNTPADEFLTGEGDRGDQVAGSSPPTIVGTTGPLSMNEDSSRTLVLGDFNVNDADSNYPTGFTLTVVGCSACSSVSGTTVTPFPDFSGTLFVDVKVNDGQNDSNVFTAGITVNPSNDAPAVTTNAGGTVDEGSTGNNLAGQLVASDVDNTTSDLAYTVTTGPANGVLSLSGVPVTTFTQSDLDNGFVAYDHDGSETTSDGFDFSVTDGASLPVTGTFGITVNPVNDAPVITAPASDGTSEDTALVFSAALSNPISIADSDAGAGAVSVQLSQSGGATLTLATTAGLSFASGDGSADLFMDFSGTLAAVNAALDGLSVLPAADDSTSFDLSMFVDDQGNSGCCSAQTGFATVSISVTPVNDAPIVTTNAGLTVDEGVAGYNLVGQLVTSDVDNTTSDLVYAVTSSPVNGTLRLLGSPATTFTQSDLDNGFVTYDHDGSETTSDGFDFSVTDGASLPATGTFGITVNTANDPPVQVTPTAAIPVKFTGPSSISGLQPWSVSDSDSGGVDIEVTLSVSRGALFVADLSASDGVGPGQIVNNGTSTVTITAPVAFINTSLGAASGVIFDPGQSAGPATVTMSSRDLGNSGSLGGEGFDGPDQFQLWASHMELADITGDISGSNGFRVNGAAAGDESGYSVSSAGDVNGDGLSDFIIGARTANSNAGQSYVVFGGAPVIGPDFPLDVDLASLGAAGFTLDGGASDLSGVSVSTAGDFNGDGYDDVVVGAPGNGLAYVVFGAASLPASVDLTALDGSDGVVLTGSSGFGTAVGGGGDVNGDGIGDLVVGSVTGFADAGTTYVFFGSRQPSGASRDVSGLTGSNGFAVPGLATEDRSGSAVAIAGKVNGDAIDDLVIGAPGALAGRGQSYVVFGQSSFTATFDLGTLNGTNGFVIEGGGVGDDSGVAVAGGDVNADGFNDVIVGADAANPFARLGAGQTYVIYGSTSFDPSISVAALGANGYTIHGAVGGDLSGFSVAYADDANGDGIGDLLIGAKDATAPAGAGAGKTYLVFGAGGVSGDVDLAMLDGSNGVAFHGTGLGNSTGHAVAAADVNTDGFADLLMGATRADPASGADAGITYGIFGSDFRGQGFSSNLGPTAADDGPFNVAFGGTTASNVFGNDSDPDTGITGLELGRPPAHATSFSLNQDGSFNYVHDGSGLEGDSFTYRALDSRHRSNLATVTITIDPPAAPWQASMHGGDLDAETQTTRTTLSWPVTGGHSYRLCATTASSTDAFSCSGGSVVSNVGGLAASPQTLSGLTAGVTTYIALVDETLGQTVAWTTVTPEVYGAGGEVWTQLIDTDGTRYIGGEFREVYRRVGGLAAFSPTDSAGHSMIMPRIWSTVERVVPDGQGGVFIGGTFDKVGSSARYGLAHIDRDGQLDTGWNPSIYFDLSAASPGEVSALALDEATNILYVGGDFEAAAGAGGGSAVARSSLAAFDATTGALLDWNPTVATPISANGVYALAVSGGTVYAGGQFTSVAGGSGNRFNLAAFDAASVGAGVGALKLSWNPGANDTVRALIVSGGKVYAGGSFTFVGGGGSGSTPRNRLAVLDATTGSVDGTWDPNASAAVNDLALDGGVMYVAGQFSTVGGSSRARIAAIDATTGTADPLWNPGIAGSVETVAVSNGAVVVGGSFSGAGGGTGTTPRNSLAAFEAANTGDGTGALKPWNADSYGANDIAVVGDVVFVGGYLQATDIVDRERLAAFDPEGNLDPDWTPVAGRFTCCADQVLALAKLGNTLYVGGSFDRAGSGQVARTRLAAFDAVNGGDGTGALLPWDPRADGFVAAMVARDGVVYAGGGFTGVNGILDNRSTLAAFDASTGTVTSWNPGTDAIAVRALALDAAGNIYAGGDFDTVGGGVGPTFSDARSKLAAFDTFGNVLSWNPGADNDVYALAIDSGTVYAGGHFTMAGGGGTGSTPRTRLAAFQDASTGDGTGGLLGWSPTVDNLVRSIAVLPGAIYVGGDFGTANGSTTHDFLAAFDSGGLLVPGWNVVVDGSVNSLVADAGVIHAGGSFFGAGEDGVLTYQADNIATFDASGALVGGVNLAAHLDSDGLDAAQEYAAGSDPDKVDADNDGADDPTEIASGTNPNDADSDDDGVGDQLEGNLGSDPLVANTTYRVDCSRSLTGQDGSSWADGPGVVGPIGFNSEIPAKVGTGGSPGAPVFVLYKKGTFCGPLNLADGTARQYVEIIGSVGPTANLPEEPASSAFDGADSSRVLYVSAATDLALRHLEIRNGNPNGESYAATIGGGVLAETQFGNVGMTLDKVRIGSANPANGNVGQIGAGLAAMGSVTVTLTNSSVEGNTASSVSGDTKGAGLYADNSAVLNVTDSKVINNTSTTSSPGVGAGGGIYVTGGTVNLTRSLVSGNSAGHTGGPSVLAGGGGLFAGTTADVFVTESVFADNTASNGPGGGINAVDADVLDVRHSQFLANSSKRPGAGLHVHPVGSTTVFNNLFVGNATTDTTTLPDGGAVEIDIDNVAFLDILSFNSNTVAYNQVLNFTSSVGGGVSVKNPIASDAVELKDNIVWFNQDGQPGTPEIGDNFISDGLITINGAGNNINETPAPAGVNNAADNPADPLFKLGFYLDHIVPSNSVNHGSAGDADTVYGGGPYTTNGNGTPDSGTVVDIGFHHAGASAGSPSGPIARSIGGCSNFELTFRPAFSGLPDGEPGRLVVVQMSGGAGSLVSLTTIDPLGTGSRIARDLGDGRYRLNLSGVSGGETRTFDVYVDDLGAAADSFSLLMPSC